MRLPFIPDQTVIGKNFRKKGNLLVAEKEPQLKFITPMLVKS
jgi:hypothetical protein